MTYKESSTSSEVHETKRDEYMSHLATIVESSDDAIISETVDGVIKSWNKGAETMFGYTTSEIVGKNIDMIIPEKYAGDEKKIVARIYNNELIHHYETERRKKNGECIFVSITISALRDRAGKIFGLSKIVRDINLRKQAEAALSLAAGNLEFEFREKNNRAAELQIANLELIFQNTEKEKRAAELIIANAELVSQNLMKDEREKQLTVAINKLAEKETALQKHNKELEQFAYVASHDLQEPLRTVSNYITVMQEDYGPVLGQAGLSHLSAVSRATTRMSNLIKSLLAFSRLGNNSELTHVDCGAVLSGVLSDLESIVKSSKAVFEIDTMPWLNAYESELGQLFQNLITNAIKFQKPVALPVISIHYFLKDNMHHFSVDDNGIGMDALHFDRAFEIFQRLPTEIPYDGSGIGLANCRKIVQLHQGEISIRSRVGHGTSIQFTIGNLTLKS